MKYVHITDSSLISRIKKNGIRKGDGRRGKGAYFIPLIYFNLKDYDGIESEQVSNIKSWKFWIREKSNGAKKPVAIIFENIHQNWPIDVYIEIGHEIALKFAIALKAKNHPDIKYFDNQDFEKVVRNINYKTFTIQTHFIIKSDEGMGKLFGTYKEVGGSPSWINNSEIECVSRSPIKNTSIRKVIPFYKTSKENKSRKNA